MNHITIELHTEDRARIERLTAALEALNAGPAQEVKPEPPKEEPKQETPTPSSEVSIEDIRSKYMTLATTPKRDEARMLIKLYANKISDIPEAKRAEVLEKLNALEG